jgi:hypothetical protein
LEAETRRGNLLSTIKKLLTAPLSIYWTSFSSPIRFVFVTITITCLGYYYQLTGEQKDRMTGGDKKKYIGGERVRVVGGSLIVMCFHLFYGVSLHFYYIKKSM